VLAPLTADAVRTWIEAQREPTYRAEQVLRWRYGVGVHSFAEMTNLSRDLRQRLSAAFCLPRLLPERVDRASDNTRKLLFRLADGVAVETVIIPDAPRLTLCVSSQAGCAMGCAFCATARLSLQRHLTADEIVGQVLAARELFEGEERLTNIVFMGMGEPLHNYDAVVQAIEVLSAPWGVHLSPRRITVSTVGLVPQMQRLMAETSVNLAVSLTATTDALRTRLVPVNRKYPIGVLLATCRALPLPQRRRITFEYVLLRGVNDGVGDAERLVRLLRGIRCKVNLIPFNPFPDSDFETPGDEVVEVFRAHLDAAHVHATVRQHRGREVGAACGQLAAAGG
jgi:23S rRNA (adenine2503-C2)-methyltransferase